MSQQVHERLAGTIRWFNPRKGFGFATPDGGGKEVFVHHSALEKVRKLSPGDRIEFGVEESEKGLLAVGVVPLNGDVPPATGRVRENGGTKHSGPPASSNGGAARFAHLGLIEPLLRAVDHEGYVVPTPIQLQAIGPVLEGRDLMGCAQTGTGKTAAFALPILQRLTLEGPRSSNGKRRPIRVLVLAPTRELANQIGASFDAYGRFTGFKQATIYGGVSQNPQVAALQRGVDILVATPGRLLDLIGQGHIALDHVEIAVLDEGDQMLDMGFIHDVKRIFKLLRRDRQTLMFSATMPSEIVDLARTLLRDPVSVAVTPEQPTVEAIEQAVYFVPDKKDKQKLLEYLLHDRTISRALVFTRTKHGANKVVKLLGKAGVNAEPIHGNKSQSAREKALANFKSGRTRVLVATDVAARGLDIDNVSHVIQYDLPNISETYVHRIGRTGRAGETGIALAFCDPTERPFLRDIEKLIRKPVPVIDRHPFAPGR